MLREKKNVKQPTLQKLGKKKSKLNPKLAEEIKIVGEINTD